MKKFPIKEFFNIQDNVTTYENLEKYYTCSGDIERCCDCDNDCMRYKTCCIDKLWDETNPIPIQEYLDKFEKVANKYKDLTCEYALPSVAMFRHTSERLLMVSSCLPNANINDTLKCLHSLDDSYESTAPVFGIDNYFYINAFCARCNFVKEYEFVNITSECEEKYEPPPNPTMILTTAISKTAAQSSRKPLLKLFKACHLTIVRSSSVKNFIRSCNLEGSKTKHCNSTNKNYRFLQSLFGKRPKLCEFSLL